MILPRKRSLLWTLIFTASILYFFWTSRNGGIALRTFGPRLPYWQTVPMRYPPESIRPLPAGTPVNFPRVQADFPTETADAREVREKRQTAVREVFAKSWASYRKYAWGADELAPVSGGQKNPFGGWAATLVDALDTLWIMGMKDEFSEAVRRAEAINFGTTEMGDINIFETTIRYLGGFLAAYDLSGDERLLHKAAEVGDMVYKAFDTPNRMPITRWNWKAAAKGSPQKASTHVLVAEIGSLSMELTRLSMVTGDHKYFDAAQRVTDAMAAAQDTTAVPGLWPLSVNAQQGIFDQESGTGSNIAGRFTLGAMADSAYEYLPKMAALLGGLEKVYEEMYVKAADAAVRYNLYRPLVPGAEDILLSGEILATPNGTTAELTLEAEGQHLVCFLGGMFALGGRLFDRGDDVEVARKLVDGCVWAYKALPHGIMPEAFHMAVCESRAVCEWDEASWKRQVLDRYGTEKESEEEQMAEAAEIIRKDNLPPGFTYIRDRRYILRPEAIESVFIMYRVTARQDLAESAWEMFQAIEAATSTRLANSAVRDVTVSKDEPVEPTDSMESFWLGETLKYFYLVFSEPGLISLDEYVLNTEAHPFKRMRV